MEDEEEDLQPVHTEVESYVNPKEELLKKYSSPAKHVSKENSKICRQFNIKKVLDLEL